MGDVQLWTLPRDDEKLNAYAATGLESISAAEAERYWLFKHPTAARRFLLGRVLMRHALAASLKCDPPTIAIGLTDHGKPHLLPPEHRHLKFSLSHSSRDWVVAVTSDQEIGVDLELSDRASHVRKIALTYFSGKERRYVMDQGDLASKRSLQLWTLKEAMVKAQGITMWQGMAAFDLAIDGTAITTTAPSKPTAWSLAVGLFRKDHCLAIAMQTPVATRTAPSISSYQLGSGLIDRSLFEIEARS